jgi:hypothetical protein
MNRELERLILAYDRVLEAREKDVERATEHYDMTVDEFLLLHPTLSRETLKRMVLHAHRNWVQAQRKPSSMPPKT